MIRCQYNFSIVYFAALLCLTVEGCSTIQPIDTNLSRQEVMRELHIGSQIEIQTKSGERLSIIVSSISETHIESSDEQFEIEKIFYLWVYFHGWKWSEITCQL